MQPKGGKAGAKPPNWLQSLLAKQRSVTGPPAQKTVTTKAATPPKKQLAELPTIKRSKKVVSGASEANSPVKPTIEPPDTVSEVVEETQSVTNLGNMQPRKPKMSKVSNNTPPMIQTSKAVRLECGLTVNKDVADAIENFLTNANEDYTFFGGIFEREDADVIGIPEGTLSELIKKHGGIIVDKVTRDAVREMCAKNKCTPKQLFTDRYNKARIPETAAEIRIPVPRFLSLVTHYRGSI